MRFEFLNRQTIASFRVDGFVRIPEILSGPALQDLQQATATAAAAATAAAGEFLLVDRRFRSDRAVSALRMGRPPGLNHHRA
jgi:hypothetical protein